MASALSLLSGACTSDVAAPIRPAWPVDSDLVTDVETMPPLLFAIMGENWRDRQAYRKRISELTPETESDEWTPG